MQIFSVQFRDGVALINHDDCYDDTERCKPMLNRNGGRKPAACK